MIKKGSDYMLEVKPNKEILKIKTSILGFTPVQIASVSIGMIAGTVTYYILPVPDFFKFPIISVIVILICSFGFYSLDGMNVFQIIGAMILTWRIYKHPLVLRGRREDYNGNDSNNYEERLDAGQYETNEKSGYHTH